MSTTSTNEEILRLQAISKIFDGYVILVLIIIGTIGNSLNIIVFLRYKTLRQMSNSVFMIAFFISNLTSLWASRFQRSMLAITGVDLLVGSIFYCKVRWLFGRWGFNMAFTSVCLSSADRFLNTSRSERYRRLITFKRAAILTTLSSIAYIVIFIPDAIYYSGYRCTASASDRAIYQQFITYFNLTMTNSIPQVILGIFCVLTWYNFWSMQRGRQRQSQIHHEVNRMMLVEFTVIFLSSTPNFIYNIYAQITQGWVKSNLQTAQENIWRNVCVTLSFVLNIGTFYIYFLMSGAYRRKVKAIFCWQKRVEVTSCGPSFQNTKVTRQVATNVYSLQQSRIGP
ncbi:unnamed protein product [Adineta ricciae]|uniref:G-protein coupled receptors family 1 profile domain-containing protein n=1 Tax=Adineta ricciae TaxID=249248 RepID=A0A815T4B3_ADIRI|nr:unnamed protein product [Adineta ricciae]CAF1499561.1 unnamed protein product [Adineta ricciae]